MAAKAFTWWSAAFPFIEGATALFFLDAGILRKSMQILKGLT
jgi:hypothetical protein